MLITFKSPSRLSVRQRTDPIAPAPYCPRVAPDGQPTVNVRGFHSIAQRNPDEIFSDLFRSTGRAILERL